MYFSSSDRNSKVLEVDHQICVTFALVFLKITLPGRTLAFFDLPGCSTDANNIEFVLTSYSRD